MDREGLIELVRRIIEMEGTESDRARWACEVSANVPHPSWTELVFYADTVVTPEEVVDAALAYQPIRL